MTALPSSLAEAEARDRDEPLALHRTHFHLPEGVVYLDGNSLGAMPRAAAGTIDDAVRRQWGEGLVRSWNSADWIGAPARIGAKIAALMGVQADEAIVADSVSVNIFKLLGALAEQRPGAGHFLTEAGNFHTDAHIAAGAARITGRELRMLPRPDVLDAICGETSALLLTHVHYKTGERYDMAAVNARAAEHGVPVVWDLSHSIGAVPLDLARDGTHYAVGCGYKYLNGGPGAPGFVYVRRDRQGGMATPLQGWMGHSRPFAFEDSYEAGDGMDRFLVGTPPILSLLALEAGVDCWGQADAQAVWAKSIALFDLFRARMAELCPELECITPTAPDRRGSHISFRHEHAWPINRALIDRGVIGDFRTPDVLRFGLTPLYTGFADVWRAADIVADIMAREIWRNPEYAEVSRVT